MLTISREFGKHIRVQDHNNFIPVQNLRFDVSHYGDELTDDCITPINNFIKWNEDVTNGEIETQPVSSVRDSLLRIYLCSKLNIDTMIPGPDVHLILMIIQRLVCATLNVAMLNKIQRYIAFTYDLPHEYLLVFRLISKLLSPVFGELISKLTIFGTSSDQVIYDLIKRIVDSLLTKQFGYEYGEFRSLVFTKEGIMEYDSSEWVGITNSRVSRTLIYDFVIQPLSNDL